MIAFFREKKFSYLMKAPSGKRGFFFFLQAGFQKDLEPLSGMTVSLPEVDRWLSEIALCYREGELSAEDLLMRIRGDLAERAHRAGARLVSLTLKEERNWTLSWKVEHAESLLHRICLYEEVVQEGRADLWRIELAWTKSARDEFDYFHESLQLLKTLPKEHKKRPERKLSPTSFLSGMSIESRAEGWTLEL